MKTMFNGQRVELQLNLGAEPSCPRCEHYNAMLHTTTINGNVSIRECRDCHLMVAIDSTLQFVAVVARSLGKSCSNCHSFNMNETKPGSWMFKCQDCSAPAVKY